MATTVADLSVPIDSAQRSSKARGALELKISLGILFVIVVAGILAPLIAPQNPLTEQIGDRLAGPSAAHLLGTDAAGRDVLSRLLYGDRSSFYGIVIALAVAIVIGVPWGLASGYLGGVWDELLMRLADVLLSIPGIVLAIAITGALGPNLVHAMAAVGIVAAPILARLLRASVLLVVRSEYVLVAESLGVSRVRVALRHVLPNSMAPVVVQLCALASLALLVEAALGFLGLGVQPPAPSWGSDLSLAFDYFTVDPILTLAPGLAITISAYVLSRVGDGVRVLVGVE